MWIPLPQIKKQKHISSSSQPLPPWTKACPPILTCPCPCPCPWICPWICCPWICCPWTCPWIWMGWPWIGWPWIGWAKGWTVWTPRGLMGWPWGNRIGFGFIECDELKFTRIWFWEPWAPGAILCWLEFWIWFWELPNPPNLQFPSFWGCWGAIFWAIWGWGWIACYWGAWWLLVTWKLELFSWDWDWNIFWFYSYVVIEIAIYFNLLSAGSSFLMACSSSKTLCCE